MVKASVMEIYDLQTQVGKGTVLKVHTPTGNNVKRHLLGHFLQYKQFKYLGARVTLIPASTLPADPLQLSYDAGDANIDPRDMVNPILWKHYHGETMLTDILNSNPEKSYDQEQNIDVLPGSALDSQIYNQIGEGSNQMDRVYPKTLMDTSFRKAGIQQGFSTFVRPFAYNVVSPVQLLPREVPTGTSTTRFMGYNALGQLHGDYPVQTSVGKLTGSEVPKYQNDNSLVYGNAPNLTLATNRLTPVGWLDTLSRERVAGTAFSTGTGAITANEPTGSIPLSGDFALCPNLAAYPMLYVLMPPAYKTEFFFRLIIKHYYAFRGFRSCFSVQSIPSAGIWTNLPAPGNYDPSAPGTSSVSSMVADLEGDDSTNTVEVENGTLLTMADGAEGDS